MIITAESARILTEIYKKLDKESIRKLKRIDRKIKRALKKKKTSIDYWSSLNVFLKDILSNYYGYRVVEKSTYDYEWFVISWNWKNEIQGIISPCILFFVMFLKF